MRTQGTVLRRLASTYTQLYLKAEKAQSAHRPTFHKSNGVKRPPLEPRRLDHLADGVNHQLGLIDVNAHHPVLHGSPT